MYTFELFQVDVNLFRSLVFMFTLGLNYILNCLKGYVGPCPHNYF